MRTCRSWILPFECRLNYVFLVIIRRGRRGTVGSSAPRGADSRTPPCMHRRLVLNILSYLEQELEKVLMKGFPRIKFIAGYASAQFTSILLVM